MKESTLHSLITAKSILESASSLCASGITHSATAGLILLQDALELVFLAALVERDVDDEVKTEKISFDQIIGELRSAGIVVPKSGTLKALNKNRVLAKHYGQLVLPETVRGYLEVAKFAIDSTLTQVIGKSIGEIFLTDLLEECEAKDFLKSALASYERERYWEALVEIRKAIFVEVESAYSIHEWEDKNNGLAGFFSFTGLKAPFHTKNPDWVAENVKEPSSFIQIDWDKFRSDALEWGVNTNELLNLRVLTPSAFRKDKESPWCISYSLNFPANSANRQNVQYCLDRAIHILLRKQGHTKLLRRPDFSKSFPAPPIYLADPVYRAARTSSPVVHVVEEGFVYTVQSHVTGFDGQTHFYGVSGHPEGQAPWSPGSIFGYLPARKTPLVEPSSGN